MICMRINSVHMIVVVMVMMPMVVIVVMMMVVIMIVVVMIMIHIQTAHARAEMIAFGTIRHVGPWGICTLPFNMMVVAFLHRTNLGFKAQNLRAILAHHTCWWRHIAKRWMPSAFFGRNRM